MPWVQNNYPELIWISEINYSYYSSWMTIIDLWLINSVKVFCTNNINQTPIYTNWVTLNKCTQWSPSDTRQWTNKQIKNFQMIEETQIKSIYTWCSFCHLILGHSGESFGLLLHHIWRHPRIITSQPKFTTSYQFPNLKKPNQNIKNKKKRKRKLTTFSLRHIFKKLNYIHKHHP